jgi:hypothetical protein
LTECSNLTPAQNFRTKQASWASPARSASLPTFEVPVLDAPKRRPWYANAIAVGFGAILGAGTLLGLNGKTAHNDAQAAPA